MTTATATAPETTPSAQSQSAMEFSPAPATVRKISGAIDGKVAATLRNIVNTDGTVTNGRVYSGTDDAQYRLDRNYMRKHLASTIDTTTQRVKVQNYGTPTELSFYLSVEKRNPRKAKAEASAS